MEKFFEKNLPFISFCLIPIVFFWHPNWLGILGNQPYWPLFWLLPWSLIYGSINGVILGLFLGLILDSLSISNSFTEIPGLILCGFWFGRIKSCSNILVEHFRYGLICSIGSFICGTLYFSQILIYNFRDYNFFLFESSFQNILTQVFLTGFFAPFFCSKLIRLFKITKNKNLRIPIKK